MCSFPLIPWLCYPSDYNTEAEILILSVSCGIKSTERELQFDFWVMVCCAHPFWLAS